MTEQVHIPDKAEAEIRSRIVAPDGGPIREVTRVVAIEGARIAAPFVYRAGQIDELNHFVAYLEAAARLLECGGLDAAAMRYAAEGLRDRIAKLKKENGDGH